MGMEEEFVETNCNEGKVFSAFLGRSSLSGASM